VTIIEVIDMIIDTTGLEYDGDLPFSPTLVCHDFSGRGEGLSLMHHKMANLVEMVDSNGKTIFKFNLNEITYGEAVKVIKATVMTIILSK
jgi:hypothetical protein